MRHVIIFLFLFFNFFACSAANQDLENDNNSVGIKKASQGLVQIEVFSSPSCLHCRNFWPVLKRIKNEFANYAVVTHYHLARSLDEENWLAAGVCAEKQGNGNKFYDFLYTDRGEPLTLEMIKRKMAELGIKNPDKCFESVVNYDEVVRVRKLVGEYYVDAVPAVFVGKHMVRADYESIRDELSRATGYDPRD